MVDHSFPKSVIQIHNRIHLDLAKDAVAKDRYISLELYELETLLSVENSERYERRTKQEMMNQILLDYSL